MIMNLFRQLALRSAQRRRFPDGNRLRPLVPLRAGVAVLQRGVSRPVVEPGIVFFEPFERLTVIAASLLGEILPRCAKQLDLDRGDVVEIDVIIRKFGKFCYRLLWKQSIAHEALRRDHQRISRVRRMAAVRRVSIARRIERKKLPHADAGALRPVEKGDQLVAEISDAVATGKGGGMEENSSRTLGDHPRASGLIASFSPRESKCCSQRLAADEPFPAFAATTGRTILRIL